MKKIFFVALFMILYIGATGANDYYVSINTGSNSTGVGTLGRVAQVLLDIPDCTVDSHVTIVRPNKKINIHFKS